MISVHLCHIAWSARNLIFISNIFLHVPLISRASMKNNDGNKLVVYAVLFNQILYMVQITIALRAHLWMSLVINLHDCFVAIAVENNNNKKVVASFIVTTTMPP